MPELVAEPDGIVVGIVIVGLGHGGTPLLQCSDAAFSAKRKRLLFYRVCRFARVTNSPRKGRSR
jgi:hypothetical protein